jgi:hypothetical protein
VKNKLSRDARILIGVTAAILIVILVGAFFAPARLDNDPTPSTYNSGSAGAKTVYLLTQQLGYHTERLEESAAVLSRYDAPHTTLILASAFFNTTGKQDFDAQKTHLKDFLERGGRILATGPGSALYLPDAHVTTPNQIYTDLCYTTPQGLGPLARAGRITTDVTVRWDANDPATRIEQLCGSDAVVVSYPVGKGEVIWWSSAMPLSNAGLKDDASLKLFLASIGEPGRTVLFDEFVHGATTSLWDTTSGTPVTALGWQLAAIAFLLVLSFGRRNGPLRDPIRTPRTSPLEFAESMGDLYRKAGAVSVATGSAERRLMRFLEVQGGLPQATLRSTPEAIAAAVAERFHYRSSTFADDIKATQEAESANLSAKSALGLVQRIDRHIASLLAIMKHSDTEGQTNDRRV